MQELRDDATSGSHIRHRSCGVSARAPGSVIPYGVGLLKGNHEYVGEPFELNWLPGTQLLTFAFQIKNMSRAQEQRLWLNLPTLTGLCDSLTSRYIFN